MLFICIGTPKPGLTVDEREKVLKLFAAWKPPTGLEIKAHYLAPHGGDFVIVETDSVALLVQATAIWAPFVTYQVTPIVDAAAGAERILEAEQVRSSLL